VPEGTVNGVFEVAFHSVLSEAMTTDRRSDSGGAAGRMRGRPRDDPAEEKKPPQPVCG